MKVLHLFVWNIQNIKEFQRLQIIHKCHIIINYLRFGEHYMYMQSASKILNGMYNRVKDIAAAEINASAVE